MGNASPLQLELDSELAERGCVREENAISHQGQASLLVVSASQTENLQTKF